MYSNSVESCTDNDNSSIVRANDMGWDFETVTDEEYNYTSTYSIQGITYEGNDPEGLEMDWEHFALNVTPTRLEYNERTNLVTLNTEVEDPSKIIYGNNVFYFPINGITGRFTGTIEKKTLNRF